MTAVDVARALPDIPVLRDRCRAVAMLDAILSPDWEDRYFSFDSRWAPGEEMASMRNGSGDAYSIVFSQAGAFVRGFSHESPMSPAVNHGRLWPGLVDSVPAVFRSQVDEPAFSFAGGLEATVCLWRQPGDDRWQLGNVRFPGHDDPDGADGLFAVLTEATPEAYQAFAENYYDRPVDLDATRQVYALGTLTDDVVRRLNPELTVRNLAEDVAQIGYPAPQAVL